MSKSDLPRGLTPHHSGSSWRYVPTPARRAQGWKTCTFKNPDGTNMTRGQALDAAEAINALIEAYEAGENIAGRPWSHLNPDAADGVLMAPDVATDTIGYLIDAYRGVRDPATGDWKGASEAFTSGLAATTQADARNRLSRLLETLAGHKEGAPSPDDMPAAAYERAKAAYDAAIARVRDTPVTALIPPPVRRGEKRTPGLLEIAYGNLTRMVNERTGKPQVTQAAAILRYASSWLTWVRKEHGLLDVNPVSLFKLEVPEGRIVIWPKDRLKAVLAQAHADGWHSVAFAVELALELSWSQTDILSLTWADVAGDRMKPYARRKTGVKAETTLTASGRALFDRIRAHYTREAGNVTLLPTQHIIRVDRRYGRELDKAVGKGWARGYFRQVFGEIRNKAWAGCDDEVCTFADLRDTAVTRMWEAGLTFPEIASRTLHSLTHIQKVIEKHYGKITRTISDSAAEKMDAYYEAEGLFSAKQV